MNYRSVIDDTIHYIEEHMDEPLTVGQLSRRSGYSAYHFCRIFTLCTGMPPMDYIRRRRLTAARAALAEGRRVTDVALDHGYDTPSGFARAFRRAFGYSPSTYAARMCLGPTHFSTTFGGYQMEPMIQKKEAFTVAGYGIQSDLSSGYTKDIAAYWETYEGESLEAKMYAQLTPPRHGEVGLCVPSPDGETITYLFGVMVEDLSRVTPDMMTFRVPAATYAVFTTQPVDLSHYDESQPDPLAAAARAVWAYIFDQWLPASPYVYDEGKSDFEFYDQRCHGCPDSVMEIWVPIRKK